MFVIIIIFNILIFYNIDKINNLFNIFDYPDNIRKLHKERVALTGGLILFANFLIIFCYSLYTQSQHDIAINIISGSKTNELYSIILGSTLFYLLGFFDDKYNIDGKIKLFLQFIIILSVLTIDPGLVFKELNLSFIKISFIYLHSGFIFSLLCYLLFINAFNLFDGINLQSGSYTLLLIVMYLILINGNSDIFLLIPSVILFLILNFKNKIFLGDSGTLFISYLMSSLFIKGHIYGEMYFADIIGLLFIVPIYEIIRLGTVRILRKENPFCGDRNHLHHILIKHFSNEISIFIILLIIIIPVLFHYIFNLNYFSFLLSFILYLSLINYLNYLEKKYEN